MSNETGSGGSGWQPPNPNDIAELLDDPRHRLVRSHAELAGVVLEVLEDVQSAILHHGDLLWDRIPQRLGREGTASDLWVPKVEGALSAYLTNELRNRLSGRSLVVNREVMVRPTDEHGAGDRTDILIEGTHSPGSIPTLPHERVAVVVEVKGPWNRDLQSAQRSQLADRYLHEAETDQGIYLVGWYPLDLWSELDSHRRQRAARYTAETLAGILQEQSVGIKDDFGLITTPVVIHVPRAHRTLDLSSDPESAGDA